jgi:DNA-binding protein HU-beta
MDTPKVSVITINFNDVVGLKKTIASVKTQTYSNIEYIIIDGGSNDGSKQTLAIENDFISTWVSEPDAGIFNAMNKGELIEKMAADAGISKAQAKTALSSFTDAVGSTLSSGGRVSLVGFGSFSVSKRNAREGRNPQTGATIQIPAKNIAKFKAGSDLNDKIA